jgi:cleavage and polyadenylation specificity factor subunit 3
MDAVEMTPSQDQSSIVLEWVSSPVNDMVADSIVALILSVETSPSSVKCKLFVWMRNGW